MKWIVALLALPVWAHDLYLMPQKFGASAGETLLVSVHTGDSFPASEAAPDPRRLLNGKVFSDGKQSPLGDYRIVGRAAHTLVRLESGGDRVVSLHTPPRLIEMNPVRFEAYLREEGLHDVLEWRRQRGESSRPGRERYRKYAKTLIGDPNGGSACRASAGLDIEFIPETQLHGLKPGAAMTAQLLWRGRPAAGLQVELAWAAGKDSQRRVLGRTGPDGRISVPLERAGMYRLHAVAMERSADRRDADWDTYWASLTFELPDPGYRRSSSSAAVWSASGTQLRAPSKRP